MNEAKVVITCPNVACKSQIRIPASAALIRFKCPNCASVYHAREGKITDPSGLSPDPVQHSSPDPSPTPSPNPSPSPSAVPQPEPDIRMPPHRQINKSALLWKIISLILFVICVYLFLHQEDTSVVHRQQVMDRITNSFINDLKHPSDNNFTNVKRFMTDATQQDFKIFIESQLTLNNDTSSLNTTMRFLNSIAPMEYVTARKFQYIGPDKDTAYFNVLYVPSNDTFQLQVNRADFLK